jgi:hypothetical protein
MDVGTCLIQTLDGALLMEVEIQPGSSQQGVTGFNEWRSRLVIAVKAEAKQGQANRAGCPCHRSAVSSKHIGCDGSNRSSFQEETLAA